MAVTTNISLHLISEVTAIDHGSFGRPLLLRLKSDYGDTDITLFFRDESLARDLAGAINDAIKLRQPDAQVRPHETAAAYEAADHAYDTAREDRMFRR